LFEARKERRAFDSEYRVRQIDEEVKWDSSTALHLLSDEARILAGQTDI
jgi:hypothetical protein